LGGQTSQIPESECFQHFARMIFIEILNILLKNSRIGPFSPGFWGGTRPPCPPTKTPMAIGDPILVKIQTVLELSKVVSIKKAAKKC